MNPQSPFVTILMDAAHLGEITLYHAYNDDFSIAMNPPEANNIRISVDTICTFDPETYNDSEIVSGGYRLVDTEGNVLDSIRLRQYYKNDCAPVFNSFNYEEIKGFRLKEMAQK
jgi:hypothetical protein